MSAARPPGTPQPGGVPGQPPARRAWLALGANLGDRPAALARAREILGTHPGITVLAASDIVRTPPVGGPQQPDYLNQVLEVRTTLDPDALLDVAQAAEQALHRTREVRWGPRTLDVDVLAVEGVTSDDPRLTLPHPRAHERAFVLVPWAQVAPQAELAGRGTVAGLLAGLDPGDVAGVQRWEGPDAGR